MTGSRAKPVFLGLFLIAAGIVTGAPAGMAAIVAQSNAPVRLLPTGPVGPAAEPETEEAPAEVRPPVSDSLDGGSTDAPVTVHELKAVDPDSVGLLDEAQGGFGEDLWEGSDRATIGRLLAAIPIPLESPAARSLLVRLLLSRASAPRGDAKTSLFETRLDLLVSLGQAGRAVQLLRVAPAAQANEKLARIEVEALFFANDLATACNRVQSNAETYSGAYWQMATAFCLALSGEHAKAALITDLLREGGGEVDPAFFVLIEALAGSPGGTIKTLADPSALLIAMARAANRDLPPDVVETSGPTTLRAIAQSPNASIEVRLQAAEKAEALGGLTIAELAEIYAGVPFTGQELSNPFSAAEANWGPRARALLIRAARAQKAVTTRAEVLQRAWRLGREKGGLGILLRASAPLLAEIEPTPDLMWLARGAGHALFAAGDVENGLKWFAMVDERSAGNPEAEQAWFGLWPLAQIADFNETLEWTPEQLVRWRRAGERAGAEEFAQRATVVFSVFDALDKPVGTGGWSRLMSKESLGPATMPTAAVWNALKGASADLRKGETILLALLALGREGPVRANPITLGFVMSSLRLVGLEREARALGLEAAVAALD